MNSFCEIPIIASSASVFDSDKHKAVDAGANEFIPKAVQVNHLLDALAKLLQLEWTYEEKMPNSTESPER